MLKDNQAQDLIEYTLILAFVALGSAALFMGAGNDTAYIWYKTTSTLSNCPSGSSPNGSGGCTNPVDLQF